MNKFKIESREETHHVSLLSVSYGSFLVVFVVIVVFVDVIVAVVVIVAVIVVVVLVVVS